MATVILIHSYHLATASFSVLFSQLGCCFSCCKYSNHQLLKHFHTRLACAHKDSVYTKIYTDLASEYQTFSICSCMPVITSAKGISKFPSNIKHQTFNLAHFLSVNKLFPWILCLFRASVCRKSNLGILELARAGHVGECKQDQNRVHRVPQPTSGVFLSGLTWQCFHSFHHGSVQPPEKVWLVVRASNQYFKRSQL